jgi:hypothetical protein
VPFNKSTPGMGSGVWILPVRLMHDQDLFAAERIIRSRGRRLGQGSCHPARLGLLLVLGDYGLAASNAESLFCESR